MSRSPFAIWRGWSAAEKAAGVAIALAVAGVGAWAMRLWSEWVHNPDLSHGFFALPAVWLLWRRAGTDAKSGTGLSPRTQLVGVVSVSLGLLFFSLLATVYAMALDWRASPTLFLLGVCAAGGAALALLLAAGRQVRWVRPGWEAVVLVAVLVLGSPLPPGTYARLTLGLQEAITVGVVETLRFAGIPALRAGNVINLGVTSVGVEEACSGVRSLVSCVIAGLILSALLLRSPWRRLVIVGLAAPLALTANFARSLSLTLLARGGVDISGAWHDGLGYAVLAVTTLILAWLASSLESGEAARGATTSAAGSRALATRAEVDAERGAWRWATGVAVATLAVAALWFGHAASRALLASEARHAATPNLEQIIPVNEPSVAGWRVETRDDLGRFAGILQTDHLLERSYLKIKDDGARVRVTVYAAWWRPGATSVSTVAAHTPEACWPGAGWTLLPDSASGLALPLADGRRAEFAERRSFVNGDYPQNVWFWHLVDGRVQEPFNPRSWRDQLALFFRVGFRPDAPQSFVRVSSNLPWEELRSEELLARVLSGFSELGVPLRRE